MQQFSRRNNDSPRDDRLVRGNEQASHAAQAYAHADRAVSHYEKLIAGDGITCADLVMFGAELAKALRRRDVARRQMEEMELV